MIFCAGDGFSIFFFADRFLSICCVATTFVHFRARAHLLFSFFLLLVFEIFLRVCCCF